MSELQAAGILAYPMGYRGLALNDQRTVGGVVDVAKTKDCYLVERFDFSRIEFRSQKDGLHLLIGGDLGVVSSEFRYVSATGVIAALNAAALEDKIAKLLAAFHPENAVYASPSTRGVFAYDFYTPTAEAGYSSPVRELFLGRPTGVPSVYSRRGTGMTALFALELICPDTRRYLYTPESKACNAGNSWSIAVPNWTAAQGASVAGVITVVLTGTGSNNCTLRYVEGSTTTDLVLDLSSLSAAAHTITIDMANGLIKEGATHRANLRTSGVDTFWRIGPGGGTFSVPTGRTALTSATLAYRQARA